jgi:hypothetical protein
MSENKTGFPEGENGGLFPTEKSGKCDCEDLKMFSMGIHVVRYMIFLYNLNGIS